MSTNWKPFIVNTEGPDDIAEFDTMREAVEYANALNAEMVETISSGSEDAPHLWAVPWRTTTYLERFKKPRSPRGNLDAGDMRSLAQVGAVAVAASMGEELDVEEFFAIYDAWFAKVQSDAVEEVPSE
ncbi:hypothetical protein D9V32_14040 [Mycetocola tolaasinivorans]|uniref:Uncharacterized protein n=1 Tax=Mycetocola tolaasinivorans TaxID=76635 RepID=A0A3L7A0K3_9MICO|nr:hypothetical protein [Mycetocola tolaasinivorans]RLP73647.1 hypothetical protein D9V32_14040 [Mycetocola tolaasinivorans]